MKNKNVHRLHDNIYITSNEKPKDGDWYLDKYNNIYYLVTKVESNGDGKKIILATERDLIKDGVQAIDDELLEWFIKNPSCKNVKTDLVPVNEFGSEITVNGYGFDKFKYKIIIPQEEPKQETLEEFIERHEITKQTLIDVYEEYVKNALIELNSQKMYSEEEVIDSIKYTIDNFFNGKIAGLNSKEIFEQFKKK
jgi:hypothetical protein